MQTGSAQVDAGSVWVAPVGTKPGADGWKLLGHTVDGFTMTEPRPADTAKTRPWFDESGEWKASDLTAMQDSVNRAAFNMARAADRYSIGQPIKWSTTIDAKPMTDDLLDLYYGNFRQRFIAGSLPVTINERTKPMSLTKDHIYTDSDGDWIEVNPPENGDECVALLETGLAGNEPAYGIFVSAETSIPLALNALGYDRPTSERGGTGVTRYRGAVAETIIPSTQATRDNNVARAIDLLIGADIYDQRVVERKAEAEAQAKRDAEYAKHKQESYDRAKQSYADAIASTCTKGINAESTAALLAALSAYETARRKLEGLPS